MSIPKLWFVIIWLCFVSSFSLAQDTDSSKTAPINKNLWTMDFRIASNFTLSSFQGTAISLSRFISDYQKIRFGISTSLDALSQEADGKHFRFDTLYSKYTRNNDDIRSSIQFTVQHLTYSSPNKTTSLYFAFGPLVGLTWRTNDYINNNSTEQFGFLKNNGSYTHKTFSIGILGSCGLEYFFSEHMSLHAEYSLAGTYSWYKRSEEIKTLAGLTSTQTYSPGREEHSSSSSVWKIESPYVLFGLSVNF